MMEIYPTIKQSRSQSPTLTPELSPATIDLFKAKEEPFTATSLYPPTTTAMDLDIKPEYDVKSEGDASPSQSPTLVADISTQKLKMSCYTTPPPSMTDGTTSKSLTPPLLPSSKLPRKAASAAIQIISDLPVARESALDTFNEILDNNYQFKSLGRSGEILESMTCDCTYEHG
jgi:[histone H3]-lysine36 N-trimethyltransferase